MAVNHCACCSQRKARVERVASMRRQGLTNEAIGAKLGVSRETARADAVSAGIRRPKRQAPHEEMRARVSVPVCVCGALQALHQNGVGGCAATGCPGYFERGA